MQKMNITSSPHITSVDNTSGIMLDVIFALMPATICGILFFGFSILVTSPTILVSAGNIKVPSQVYIASGTTKCTTSPALLHFE